MNTRFNNYIEQLEPHHQVIAREAVDEYLKGVSEKVKTIRTAADVVALLQYTAQFDEEHFMLVCLKNSGAVIKTIELFKGGLASTLVDVRVIMREALLANATRIIVSHNHPGGTASPSRDDENITERIQQACNALNINLLDHVIIAGTDYYSFAENDKL